MTKSNCLSDVSHIAFETQAYSNFKNEFNDQKSLLQFVDKYNLQGNVDWTELYNTFSEDMDLKLSI